MQATANKSTGQFAVFAMLALAVVAAVFSWWWNYNRGRKALEFYGPQAATLIRTAPKVEIILPDEERTIDISHAPGLLNARASLLSDASYDWSIKTEEPSPNQPAIRFSNGDQSVIILFNFPAKGISVSPGRRIVKLKTKTVTGWKSYIERQIRTASPQQQP